MSQTKIKVPEGMLLAASEFDPGAGEYNIEPILEAALRWMSENPIVPTAADALTLLQERVASGHLSNKEYCAIPATTIRCVIREWQRRMFLAPEPEVPEVPEVPKNVLRFHATLSRPATVRDDPSEREKKLGIREKVLCVRASDYDNLLNLIQRLPWCGPQRKKTSS